MGIEEKKYLVFTYGTLKKGFPNHVLLEDLIKSGDAEYLGVYRSKNRYPLVCGPYKVPFLLNFSDSGNQIFGELYSVSKLGLDRMDELEGISNGHYERLPIQIVSAAEDEDGESGSGGSIVEAVAYYGHRNYAEELWKRNGEKGFSKYSEEEAKGYIRRKDRPKNIGLCGESLRIFQKMHSTALSYLVCSSSADILRWGMGIHGLIFKLGLDSIVCSGRFEVSKLLFLEMSDRDLISWLSDGFQHSNGHQGCFSCMFSPQSSVQKCHCVIIRTGFHANLLIGNTQVTMYRKCGMIMAGERIVHIMPDSCVPQLW
ncbi:hypothetical protein MKX03_018662 [Papaver bracteatum]|nr:hypothetical protein MKX03_018662 [Papaver bracteatum]